MSILLMDEIWRRVDLPANRKIVLLKLADHANDNGGSIYPSVGRIAHECGLSIRTVQVVLREFEAEGAIHCERNDGGGKGKPRVYWMSIQRVQELHPLEPYGGTKGCSATAPFEDPKGADDDPKGADDDAKGCSSSAPKPPLTTSKNQNARAREPSDDQPETETQDARQGDGACGTGAGRSDQLEWLAKAMGYCSDDPDEPVPEDAYRAARADRDRWFAQRSMLAAHQLLSKARAEGLTGKDLETVMEPTGGDGEMSQPAPRAGWDLRSETAQLGPSGQGKGYG